MKSLINYINEEFKAPEKTLKEKVFRLDKQYAARVAAAEKEYYDKKAQPFIKRIKDLKTMQDLLDISREIAIEGFQFPVSGMIDGTDWQHAKLGDIRWQSYDRDSTVSAKELALLDGKGKNVEANANDFMIYTYYLSWKWWVANIIRCLVFWKEPYGDEANSNISNYIQKYAPSNPMLDKYPDYFTK